MFSASDMLGGVKQKWFGGSPAAASAAAQSSADPVPLAMPSSTATASNSAADAMPTPSLAEVLRFNITVEWVMHRWPRVSTGLSHLQLQGYRVSLVTGTAVTDVAGSLTYYFDARQQLQRITLRGVTGNPGVLVALLTSRYRFARRLTNDPGVVLYEAVDSSNQPTGTLKIHLATVIKANQPYARFEFDLVLDRPQ